LPIKWIWSHKDKLTRLIWVAGQIEIGDVYFLQKQDNLIEQLTNFPEVEHDDELDAFVFCLQYFQKQNEIKRKKIISIIKK
jgi:predicted phage terminase large subunit-like protein